MTNRRELPPGLYLHFLDRELGDAFEFELRPAVAVGALAALALGTGSPLFCSMSALLENPGLEGAEAPVVDLADAGVLLPYSTHGGFGEFIESRRILYRDDQDRYPAYFADRLPGGLGRLQPITFTGGGSTTLVLDARMAGWAAGDTGAGAAQHLPAAQRQLMLGHVGERLRERDGRAVTYALFSDLAQRSTDRPLERAVRRQISLEYTNHHRSAHDGRIPTGVADALHLLEADLQPDHHAEWDVPVLKALLHAAGLRTLVDGWPRELWQPLLALRGDDAHVRFVDQLAWICDALDSAADTGDVPMRRARQLLAVRRHARAEEYPAGADVPDLLDWATRNVASMVARMRQGDLRPHLDSHRHRVMPETADILLLVATDVEETETLAAFGHPAGARVRSVPFGIRVFLDLGTVGGQRVWLARTEMGASGAAGSQAVATDAIARLKPSWTVMVGIAFGIDRDTQKIGDVLVPTEVVLYDNQRVGADRTEIRVGRPTADAMLIARLRAARIDWTTSSVHFGALLSGDDLVDNEEHRDWLLQEAAGGRAIGGEMELSGVFAAAEIHKARWIAAKAICDWAAAKNNRGKAARQRKAARNAALFVRHAVDRGLLASPGD